MCFENYPLIINPDKSHIACLFLIDSSGAMNGEILNDTLKALNTFREEIKNNKSVCEVLDVAVVEFNSTAHVIQEFVPVEYMEPVYLTVGGTSVLNYGLRIAIDKILERHRVYRRLSTLPYVPYLVVITDDGFPDSPVKDIAEEIRELEKKDILRLFVMGTKGSRMESLRDLGLGNRILLLDEHILSNMFDGVLMGMGGSHYYEIDKDGNKYLRERKQIGQDLPHEVVGSEDWL